MQKYALFFSTIVVIAVLVSPIPVVLAQSNPFVIEEMVNELHLEYTVVNPNPSNIGGIVGFIIEVDPDKLVQNYLWANAWDNGWQYETLDNPNTQWDSSMISQRYGSSGARALTWSQFFGGIDYPFGDWPAAAFFVDYSEISSNTFKFIDHDLTIEPGESLGDFKAYVRDPASMFYLAYISDAESDTFDNTGLPSFHGEAIPEPATLLLLGLGSFGLIRNRKA